MDERSSTDDASASRVSLVDSRRLMFEKIVTSKQASRPDLATDEGAARINRRNGRQPRSFCADKVNSFRDQLGSSSCTDEPAKSFVTEVAPFISRHSCDVAGDQPVNDDGRVVVTSPVAASSLPPLPSGENTVIAVSASENNSSSDENDSQVPTNQCHPSVDTLPSSKNNPPTLAILCQLSGDTNHPPNSSKRTSYHRAVLNGAKLRVAKTVSPPVTVNETSPTVDPLRNGGDVNDPPLDRSPPESKGASDQRLTAEIAISSTPTVTHSSVKDLSVALNDRLRSSSSSSPNTCEPVMVTSGGNVADEPSPSVADVVATSAVDFVFTNVADIVDTGAANVVATSSADTVIIHAAEPSVTCVSDVAAADVANVAATAAANVVVTGAHNVVTTTTTVTTTVINPTVSATVSLASVTAASIDYPEDLNPFDDDDDENDVSGDALEVSRGNISGEHNSTNPFGSDSEDEHADESKITSASTNPFWSGSEEEDSEENLSPRKPVPLPRTVKKPVASSSPLPSPRPRPRVTTGCSSSEISPATSCHKLSGDSADLAFHRSSTSINNFTMRKKKPAPPPPPLQANSNHVAPQNDQNQNSNIEQTEKTESSKTNSDDSAVSVTDLKLSANKKMVSPWKNKKRPAPARPTPQRRPVKEMPLEDIQVELNDIEIRYQELERQTTQLEENIHLKTELESAESSAVEEMVVQLFELVNEKNELFRRRSELVNMRKMHSLEVEQADIEYQMRCLMMRPESNKTDTDKANEEALLKRLLEIVEKRNEIIDLMDQDRLRETVEDQSVTTQLGLKKNGHEKKDSRSHEKKKKSKKEKNKASEDGEKHSPSKLIKQKFMTLRHNAKKLHPKLPD